MGLYENTIRLKGFLGRSAEIRADKRGREFIVLSLATRTGYRNSQTGEWVASTDWHRLVASGQWTELAQTLREGDYIFAEGELRSSQYAIAEGKKRRVWEVRVVRLVKLAKPDSYHQ
jgi:single-stranded DNA-binding protein